MIDIMELQERYERLNGSRPANAAYVQELQAELGIRLPADFAKSLEFFDGSGFSVLPLFAIAERPASNILTETKRLRGVIGLPNQFVVLGEPPESLIVMNCDKGGQVLWCDAIDAPRLGKENLSQKPQVWNSFGEFFAYLLEEEEVDRE